MITILWGREPSALTNELSPASESAGWNQYRALVATHYAALVIDCETVAHNLNEGPIVPRGVSDD